MAEDLAHDVVRHLASNRVVGSDAALVDGAIGLARRYGVALWDAGIIVAAKRGGCTVLVSEDLNDGQAYDGVRVTNPFA